VRHAHPPVTSARLAAHLAIAVAVAAALVLVIPLVGGQLNLREALRAGPWASAENTDALIFWSTRVPRILLGLLVGGTLAVAGLVFQAVLRNPLAEPYILGISGGAALGKTIAVMLALGGTTAAFALMPVAAFAGALAPILVLQAISARVRRFSAVTILLAGVMLNVFFSAVILFLQYFADLAQVRQMFLWSMGGLDIIGYRALLVVAPIVILTLAVVLAHARAMNVLSLGESAAAHLGIEVRRTVNVLIWCGAILTSAVVAVSGPIGFVGLIVPHILRLIFGADNRMLVPLSVVYGGVFLVVCDFIGWRGMEIANWLGFGITQTSEIPAGVITSLLGGPFFLWLLVTKGSRAQR
jgi:iron complex transport system permease protein